MAAKKKTKKKTSSSSNSDVIKVDFSDTESRGGKKSSRRPYFEEGDYLVKITKAERDKSRNKKTPLVRYTFKFVDGEYKGKEITEDFYLTAGSLFRLRNCFEAAGVKLPSKEVKINIQKPVGNKLAITIEDDVYEDDNGKEHVNSRVVDTFSESELEEVEEDADAELDDDEEDEEDEDEEEDDEEDDDEDDLEEVDVDEL